MKTQKIGSNQKILTECFREPLETEKIARIDIQAGYGNLDVDRLPDGEPVLASGSLQYSADQGRPIRERGFANNQVTLAITEADSGRRGFRFPWAAMHGAIQWQIHINPAITTALTARSKGGNIRLDLAAAAVTDLQAETGGGSLDILLPDYAPGLRVSAQTGGGNITMTLGCGMSGRSIIQASSGAGNVTLHIPEETAARIDASTGMGKTLVDASFIRIDTTTYQSPNFDTAANPVTIKLHSGAGNVQVCLQPAAVKV